MDAFAASSCTVGWWRRPSVGGVCSRSTTNASDRPLRGVVMVGGPVADALCLFVAPLLPVWMCTEPVFVGATTRGGDGGLVGGGFRSMAKLFLPGGDRFYCAGMGATRVGEGGLLACHGKRLYTAAGHTVRHALPDVSLGTDGGPAVLGECSPSVRVRSRLLPPPLPPAPPPTHYVLLRFHVPPPSRVPPPPPQGACFRTAPSSPPPTASRAAPPSR